jgi:hypothetical protein
LVPGCLFRETADVKVESVEVVLDYVIYLLDVHRVTGESCSIKSVSSVLKALCYRFFRVVSKKQEGGTIVISAF